MLCHVNYTSEKQGKRNLKKKLIGHGIPEYANLLRQKVAWWLSTAGGEVLGKWGGDRGADKGNGVLLRGVKMF